MPRYPYTEAHGDGYRATVRMPSGARTRGPVRATRKLAHMDARELLSARDAATTPGSTITLGEAQSDLLALLARRRRRRGTIEAAEAQGRALLAHWSRDTPLRAFTRTEVEWMVDRRIAAGTSPATVRKHVAHLARLLQSAIDAGRMPGPNAARLAETPRADTPERVVCPVKVARDAQVVASRAGLHREACAIKLLRLTGLRRTEASHLSRDAVRADLGYVEVRHAKDHGRPRRIPLTPPLSGVLAFLLGDGDHVFASAGEVGALCRRVARLVGDRRIRPHAIRHGVGDRVAEASGGDVTAIAEVLGHAAGSRMTMRYAEAARDRIRAAFRALE